MPRFSCGRCFFLNGLNFGLRGGEEQRRLRHEPAQITLHETSEVPLLKYTDDCSKTLQGGLKHTRLTPKVITHYANLEMPESCHFRLFKKY